MAMRSAFSRSLWAIGVGVFVVACDTGFCYLIKPKWNVFFFCHPRKYNTIICRALVKLDLPRVHYPRFIPGLDTSDNFIWENQKRHLKQVVYSRLLYVLFKLIQIYITLALSRADYSTCLASSSWFLSWCKIRWMNFDTSSVLYCLSLHSTLVSSHSFFTLYPTSTLICIQSKSYFQREKKGEAIIKVVS